MTTHIGDDRGPYYRIRKDATGESVAVPEPRDHPATGRDQTPDHPGLDATDHDQPDTTRRDHQEDTTMAKATGRATTTRRGAEISIGLLLLTIATGVGAYYLTAGLLGWPHDIALVLAGLVSGLLTSAVLGPLWHHARATVGDWITPGRKRA